MKLFLVWLLGVPTLVASMLLVRLLPATDPPADVMQVPQSVLCDEKRDYSTANRTTCRRPSLYSGNSRESTDAPSSSMPTF